MLDTSYILPKGRTEPTHCMIALHGYCQSRDYMVKKLAKPLAEYFPEMMFVVPNAMDSCRKNPEYFDWLRYDGEWTTENIILTLQKTTEHINRFIDQILADYEIDSDNLFLSGFSQGAALALYAATRREQGCAGVLGFSGAITRKQLWQPSQCKPPVGWIYDPSDTVLPLEKYLDTFKILEADALNVTTYHLEGADHCITDTAVGHGREFIHACLVR